MSRVRTSFWLDGKKYEATGAAGLVPGRVVGPGENGTLRVEVGQSGNVVNVPSGGGAFATGSEVSVSLGADGAPSGVLDATGAFERGGTVYAGAEGREIREASERSAAAVEAASRVSDELRDAHADLMEKIKETREKLAAAQGEVEIAKLMYTQGAELPTSRFPAGASVPVGAVYERVDGQGKAIARYRWDGSSWKDFKPTPGEVEVTKELWARLVRVAGDATVGGRLLVGESVTADKLVASKELSAKVARFDETVVSKLKAQKAVITGDLIANRLVGKEIVGSTVQAVGPRMLVELSAPPHEEPRIRFASGVHEGGSNPPDSEVILTPEGVAGTFASSGGSDFAVLWNQLLASPYYSYASGKTRIGLQAGKTVRVPLRADLSARGRQVRVVNGTSVVVPESGRYRVTGWGAFWSEKWDTTAGVMLLRAGATDAGWGDLYGYAIAPVGAYATPSFTGLVDIKAGESIALGVRANAASAVYDYRFEVEFVCPL